MAFNSAAIEEFQDIWVFCEQRDGKLMNTDFELISEGASWLTSAAASWSACCWATMSRALPRSWRLDRVFADKVIVCEDPALKVYTTDAYTKVLCEVAMDKKPEVILIGASNIGRDLGPRCAARLHTGLTADCTHLDIDMNGYLTYLKEGSTIDVDSVKWNMEDVNLKMTRPAFGGHLMATIICPRFRPCMSTVRPGVMKKAEFNQAKADACEIEIVKPTVSDADIEAKVLEVVKEAKEQVDLIGADVIVSVGRGINKDVEKGIELAQQLADAFGGGVVGSSRALVDAGVITADHQVGQTGKTVHPRCMWLWVFPARSSTIGWYAGFRAHHRGEQERDCPHLRCGRLRHLRRSVQGRSHDDRRDQRCKGFQVIWDFAYQEGSARWAEPSFSLRQPLCGRVAKMRVFLNNLYIIQIIGKKLHFYPRRIIIYPLAFSAESRFCSYEEDICDQGAVGENCQKISDALPFV